MNQNTTETTQTPTEPRRSPFNPLWVSCFILMALIIMQAQSIFAQPLGENVARAGMVIVTVNPGYQASEVRYVLNQSKAVGLFCVDSFRGNPMLATKLQKLFAIAG